eukprot:TRINITY_DN86107_c0_g1_i1.p1 TRINITY_DN86107_c0_g1~~TRINITY_DN86107_c0_g1_i1.p1  ORF type:complete len:188 (+),score=17.92 TRINITY_DN86107_c0_g1_i1:41-604(+)
MVSRRRSSLRGYGLLLISLTCCALFCTRRGSETFSQPTTKWLYRAVTKIKVRMYPDVNSPTFAKVDGSNFFRNGWTRALEENEAFEVSEVKQVGAQTYYKLANQDGWVFGTGIAGAFTGKQIVIPVQEEDGTRAEVESLLKKVERTMVLAEKDKWVWNWWLGLGLSFLAFGIWLSLDVEPIEEMARV